jgi:hypothetical protein
MVSAKEFDRSYIIHGPLWLLPNIYKMFFKDWKSNHFLEKEGSEVRMDFQV